jgi:hypothetical protein
LLVVHVFSVKWSKVADVVDSMTSSGIDLQIMRPLTLTWAFAGHAPSTEKKRGVKEKK